MCGRFTLQITPEMLAEIFGLLQVPVSPPRYNIAPTQQIHMIRQQADYSNHLSFAHWGLIPHWMEIKSNHASMINARCETLSEKPSFRNTIKHHRCLIPASGFFEWRKEGDRKIPLYIHLKNDPLMTFAGLWESYKSKDGNVVESCSIVTTVSNGLIAPFHDRMPVILHPSEFPLWLDRDMHDTTMLTMLYQPFPAELMTAYEVSTLVNNARNDSLDCITPVKPPATYSDIQI